MTFIKMLIGLPVVAALLVFAFVNNDLLTFSLWPFYVEITVSSSVAIVTLFLLGFFFGTLFSWMSYAPKLMVEKSQNKKLKKAQSKLTEKVTDLQEDISELRSTDCALPKPTLSERIKLFFKKKD